MKPENTDWSFPSTVIPNKMFAFSFYVNFLQKVFSPKEKAHRIPQKPMVTEMKWNKNDSRWIVMKTGNMTQAFEKDGQVYYKSKFSKCFQHQNGLAA